MEESQHICEESLFRRVFRAHSKDLYNFLYYKYGADNHPEDLMQEAFAKLWDNCKRVSADKARAFLFTVANNQMLNELARKNRPELSERGTNNAYQSIATLYIRGKRIYEPPAKGH